MKIGFQVSFIMKGASGRTNINYLNSIRVPGILPSVKKITKAIKEKGYDSNMDFNIISISRIIY